LKPSSFEVLKFWIWSFEVLKHCSPISICRRGSYLLLQRLWALVARYSLELRGCVLRNPSSKEYRATSAHSLCNNK
jgi:hypothetical protein